jgi:hypothetical protein
VEFVAGCGLPWDVGRLAPDGPPRTSSPDQHFPTAFEVRFPAVKALLVVLLMVLAVSPLTAPFSVHVPVDAFGDVAWTPSKKAADDLKADGRPPVGMSLPGADGSMPAPVAVASPAGVQGLHRFPLRI